MSASIGSHKRASATLPAADLSWLVFTFTGIAAVPEILLSVKRNPSAGITPEADQELFGRRIYGYPVPYPVSDPFGLSWLRSFRPITAYSHYLASDWGVGVDGGIDALNGRVQDFTDYTRYARQPGLPDVAESLANVANPSTTTVQEDLSIEYVNPAASLVKQATPVILRPGAAGIWTAHTKETDDETAFDIPIIDVDDVDYDGIATDGMTPYWHLLFHVPARQYNLPASCPSYAIDVVADCESIAVTHGKLSAAIEI